MFGLFGLLSGWVWLSLILSSGGSLGALEEFLSYLSDLAIDFLNNAPSWMRD